MASAESREPYEMEITVLPADIDVLGHVNNVVYLRWVQDVATAHWFAVATPAQQAKLLWVVAKHEIEYKRPAYESDVLILRTWVGRATRRLFERHTEVLRKSDGKRIARVRSLWSPIDAQSHRPVKVGRDVYEGFSTRLSRPAGS